MTHLENPPFSPRSGPKRQRLSFGRAALLVLCVVLALPIPAGALVDLSVTDAVIAEVTATPSASDPGPILQSGADGLSFSSALTNQEVAWYVDLTAVNNTSAPSATIQGVPHTFADWFYLKTGAASKFASPDATGVFDSDAAAYTVPVLFTKSSQGSMVITSYDGTTPAAPTSTTYFWAYDAVANRYVFGTSKNLAAQTQIAPVTDVIGLTFIRTLEANPYVVASVGSSPDYAPTLKQGAYAALLSLPLSETWYVMMDTPAGVHEDTYDFTLTVTAVGL